MKPSAKLLKTVSKDVSKQYINAIIKDFHIVVGVWDKTKLTQGVYDVLFATFLTGNLNATNLDTEFGKIMSPFLVVNNERNGTRSRAKSTK